MKQKNGTMRFVWFSMITGLLVLSVILSTFGQPFQAAAQTTNTAPMAVDDQYGYTFDGTRLVAAPGVLWNDTDADGDPLTAVLLTPPSSGSLTLNPDGSFSYTPIAGFTDTTSFAYSAYDGVAYSNSATVTLVPGTCMGDVCDNYSPCTANDVVVSIVSVYDVRDYCTYIGDTGEYQFLLEFVANSNTRYDPTVFISTDGDNAIFGECYKDYFPPPLATYPGSYDPLTDFYGPYWDLEDTPGTGDECGDIVQDQRTYKITDWITLECTANLLDGTIDTALAWDNQPSKLADACVGGGCPGTGAKCRVESVPVEVSLMPVNLSLTKVASDFSGGPTTKLDPGEIFKYTLTVTNTSDYLSHGYTIYDDLPIWLKFIDDPAYLKVLPEIWDVYEDTTTADDGLWGDNTAEWCAGDPGCAGYGDIIYMNEQEDLLAGQSRSYSFWVQFWNVDDATTYCEVNPADPRCLTTVEYQENPDNIYNEACVLGFDREDPALTETYSGDNCDEYAVPTEVELLYFSAAGTKKAIVLMWETSQERDNVGFNIYRSTSLTGTRTKVNKALIPSKVPGSSTGAVYTYTDKLGGKNSIKPYTIYYYWLESVSNTGETEIFGPASASLTYIRIMKK